MTKTFQIIDNTTGRVIARERNERTAHARVETSNMIAGHRRYRVQAPGQSVGLD